MRQSGTSTEFRKSQHNSGSFVARAYSSVSWLSWRVLPTLLGGLILRLWMRHAFPPTDVDTQIYGDMAKNLLLHHPFATTLPSSASPATHSSSPPATPSSASPTTPRSSPFKSPSSSSPASSSQTSSAAPSASAPPGIPSGSPPSAPSPPSTPSPGSPNP